MLSPAAAALVLALLLLAIVSAARLATRLEKSRQLLSGAQHAAGLPSRAPLQTGDVVVFPLDILAVDASKKTLTVAWSQDLADVVPRLPKATSDAPADTEAFCNPASNAPAPPADGPLLLLAPWTRGYRVRYVPTPGPPAPAPGTVTLALCEAPAADATAATAPAAPPSLLSAAPNLVNKRVFAAFWLL
jgi:hypothetical protein